MVERRLSVRAGRVRIFATSIPVKLAKCSEMATGTVSYLVSNWLNAQHSNLNVSVLKPTNLMLIKVCGSRSVVANGLWSVR